MKNFIIFKVNNKDEWNKILDYLLSLGYKWYNNVELTYNSHLYLALCIKTHEANNHWHVDRNTVAFLYTA